MLELLGNRRKELLTLLLENKAGLTVDEMAQRTEITRNAVRQHLTALANDRLVTQGRTRPSGGRPEQLYVLTDKGREFFPRQYSWFSRLLVESIKRDVGIEGLRERLRAIGSTVGANLGGQYPELENRQQKVDKLAEVMEQMGYSATSLSAEDNPSTIEADNCVYHDLAMEIPEICQFDLALLESFTDSEVDHQECMAKGDNVCRFRFIAK